MKEKIWSKDFILGVTVLFAVCLLTNIGISIMPIFAKNLTGIDAYAGTMTSVFALTALSMRFVSGKLDDVFGSKNMTIVGSIITLIASILFLYCTNITTALIYRGIQGIGFGIAQTAISTYIIKVTPPSKMMEGVNYAALFNSLSSVFGPLIGFALIGAQYENFTALFVTGGVISVFGILIMFFGRDARLSQEKENTNEVVTNTPWNVIIIASTILFFLALSYGAILSFLSVYAIELGLSGIGTFFTISALGVITARFIATPIIKRIGMFQMILCSLILFLISFMVISISTSLWQLLMVAFPVGLGFGVTPIINVFLIQKFTPARGSIANALFFSCIDIAFSLGALIWGIVLVSIGFRYMYLVAGMLLIIPIVLSVVQFRVYKEK